MSHHSDAAKLVARAFCKANRKAGDEEFACPCDKGHPCHAPTLYMKEAVAVVVALHREGYIE